MSLTIALRSALASMQAVQTSFQVTSSNVANASNEDYTRKVTSQSTLIVDGLASGVKIESVRRVVDENLVRQLREQLSVVSNLSVQDSYYTRMQQMFGTLADDSSLSHSISELGAAIDALSTTPESAPARTDVVNLAIRFADELSNVADNIQQMRKDADAEIARAVKDVNDQATNINDLNFQIATAKLKNQPTGELEDQRDVALAKLGEQIDISTFARTDGTIVVFTKSGRPLVDNSVVPLSHTETAQLSAGLTYPNGIGPISYGSGGPDITGEIRGGRLAALIDMRDSTLVNLQAEVDIVAETLRDEVNALHNNGTSFPPPTTLTGARTVASTDAPSMTGTFRVGILSTSGNVVESLDINLGGLAPATIGQLVTTINGMTNATASINAQGKVVISATGGNTVAVNEMTSAVTYGNQTRGMAHFLGLNDFLSTGEAYADYTSDRFTSSTTALGLSGTLTFAYPGGTTAVAYAAGDSLTDIVTSINGNGTLTGQNISAAVRREADGFRLEIMDADNNNFFVTDTSTFVSTYGVRAGEPGISSLMSLRTDIAADPNKMALGVLDSGTLTVGNPAASSGNATTISAIAAKFSGTVSFRAAGTQPASTTRFADYATSIITLNATNTENATNQLAIHQARAEAIQNRALSVSQVNIDEEMSEIMILQQAYSASARVTTSVSEMLDTLLSAVR